MQEPFGGVASLLAEMQHPMPKHHKEGNKAMESGFRRLIGTESNRRYLGELPVFRIDPKLPPSFDSLLEDIDRAERKRSERGSRARRS
jgi:hypothetical protein